MEFTAKQIAEFVQGKVEGDENVAVHSFAKIEEGTKGAISFLSNLKYLHYIYETQSSIVLINDDVELEKPVTPTLIRVKNAYESVAKLLQLYQSMKPQKTGVDPLAFISPKATLGKDVFVGAFAYVGDEAVIGDGTLIHPHAYIGEQVQIRLTKDLVEVYFKGSRMTSHKRLEKYSVQPIVKQEHMPANHREYLNYNADQFKEWASSVGTSTEEVVRYFLNSGSVPEQGYKSCVSLTKLGKRYGKKKLEAACERMLAFSSSPSIRTITTLLKNSKEPDKPTEKTDDSNKYGITRGAAYWRKVGGSK